MSPSVLRYRFGPFELDLRNRELRNHDQVVPLTPQSYTVLEVLVSRPGTLVTRDELRAALWGDDQFVDFDAGLNFCVARLRKVLSDPAQQSSYVLAVPRRGYKFVAPVEAVHDTAATSSPGRTMVRPRVALAMAATLALAVAASSVAPVPVRKLGPVTSNLAAAKNFTRGAVGLADAGPDELTVRVSRFEDAIAADERFADAFAMLGDARMIRGAYRAELPAAAYAAARAAAARAVALAPDLAEAHAVLGASMMYAEWNWREAGDHLRMAVALNPESVRAHQWLSRYFSARGEHREAVAHASRAVALAPGSPSARTDLGLALFYSGDLKRARSVCEEATALLPQFVPARMCAADARIDMQRQGDADYWRGRLERATRLPLADREYDALSVAIPLVHLGERDQAMAVLERAADLRSDAVLYAAVHPSLAALRSDPGFQRLLTRIGLVH